MSYDQFNKRCFIDMEDTLYLLGGSIDKHMYYGEWSSGERWAVNIEKAGVVFQKGEFAPNMVASIHTRRYEREDSIAMSTKWYVVT